MTNWLPDISQGSGPIYIRLADKIEADIASGTLPRGTKLPPQRNLAFDIGVTIGTIGRGYQLAIERGLATAEVGRGTFIRSTEPLIRDNEQIPADVMQPEVRGMELGAGFYRMNSTSATDIGQSAVIATLCSAVLKEEPLKSIDYVRSLEPSWQEAGHNWLSTGGWSPELENVFPTMGVHSAMVAIVAALTQPGDKVAFESLTYASLSRAVTLIGRRPVQVDIGENGLDPDDFARVCAQQHPKVLMVIPTLHNPTTAIIPEENRRRIAQIAHDNNVMIIEDNIYGRHVKDAPPPLAAMAPERTFHVSGLSKNVGAGLRAGWISCPANFRNRLLIANKAMVGGNTYMLTEVAARLVNSGEADRIGKQVSAHISHREVIVREIFNGLKFKSHPEAAFVWLQLPEPWVSGTFKTAAREQGILIDSAYEFKSGQSGDAIHKVRVATIAIQGEQEFRQSLMVLRELMDSGCAGYDDYS
ncbi:MAG: PLP-dependent aminotransferase family protein [Rhizobiaceae bacterium]